MDILSVCPFCNSTSTKKQGIRAGFQRRSCDSCGKYFQTEVEGDAELVISNVQLAKQKQRLQDTNRVERKSFREHSRIENAVAEFNEQLIELLKTVSIDVREVESYEVNAEGVGVLQLSDLHLNELIAELFNKYDF